MNDSIGRVINYLRLSLTQRCQLKCIYCRSEKCEEYCEEELSMEEILIVLNVMAEIGIKKVRITGGEPLLRNDIIKLVEQISKINGIEELAITTNAQILEDKIELLINAGITKFNISVDSLNIEKYKKITGGGDLNPVLRCIDKLESDNRVHIKINTVLMNGINDDEVDDFINLTRDKNIDVRFIELMPMNSLRNIKKYEISFEKILNKYISTSLIEAEYLGQPSKNFKIDGYKGKVGFITPLKHKFCNECNRIRLLSNGKIRPCLGCEKEVDIKSLIYSNNKEDLRKIIKSIIYNKPIKYEFDDYNFKGKDMNKIGG